MDSFLIIFLYSSFQILIKISLIHIWIFFVIFLEPERHYIFEYAKEFGFFRLSQETRKRLKIPVKIINLGMISFSVLISVIIFF